MNAMRALLVAAILMALLSCGTDDGAVPSGFRQDSSAPPTRSGLGASVYDADAKQIARALWGMIPDDSIPSFSRPGTYYISTLRDDGSRDGLLVYEDGTGVHVTSLPQQGSRPPSVVVSKIRMKGKADAWTAMQGAGGAMFENMSIRVAVIGNDIELRWGPIKPRKGLEEALVRNVLLVRTPPK